MSNSNVKLIKHKILAKPKVNEIMISRKRKKNNLNQFYFKRANKLFTNFDFKEIFVSGMGACVNEAISLSLFIVDAMPNVSIGAISSSTVTHYDEYVQNETNERIEVKENRKSNIIKIQLIKN